MLLVHLQDAGGDANPALGLLDPVSGGHAGDFRNCNVRFLYGAGKFPGRQLNIKLQI
jgi:hypothetical protein